MSKVDLHLHSSVSDGKFTPAEVVCKAAEAGLSVIALTDHDNVDGIAAALEAAKEFPWLRVIPGVEISTEESDGETHVLGYFINYTHRELLETLKIMRASRHKRAKEMVDKLAALELPVDWQRVQEIAGSGSIGRPHIAQALLEKGYIATLKEAFDKYIAWGGPAYVEREKISPAEAVRLILRAGGLPVLAHPLTINDPETQIARLKESGLIGIEAYYGEYTPKQVQTLLKLADKYGFLATGGSDYHGLDDNAETMIGGADVPMSAAEQLMALAEKRTLKPASPR